MEAWVQALKQRRLVPFVGAGVSTLPPSALPSWLRFNQAVLEALASVARPVIGGTGDSIVQRCLAAEAGGRLPPEYAAEICVERFGDGYFEVLRALEGDRPNHVHRALASLLATRRVPAVVTTSFDTLLEQACAEQGVHLRVLVAPEDYAPFASADAFRWHLEDRSAAPVLLKLHGTATQPKTCVDTLGQRKRGLPPAVAAAVRAIASQTHLCVLGFSGADLEAEPNYLGLRSLAASPATPGFTWLYRPGSMPPPSVRALAELYGPRARLVEGRLPDWLFPAEQVLAEDDRVAVPPDPPDPLSAEERKAAAETDLDRRARAWAADIVETVRTDDRPLGSSSVWSAILLTDFATHVGQTELARAARRDALDHARVHEPRQSSQAALLLRVAEDLADQGSVPQALDAYRAAVEVFDALGDASGFGASLVAYATLLDRVGAVDLAERHHRQAMDLFRAADDVNGYVNAVSSFANSLVRRGGSAEAEALLREAVLLASVAGQEDERTRAMQNLAIALGSVGRVAEAVDLIDEADAVHERLGMERRWVNGRILRAGFHTRAGEVADAERLLAEASATAERIAESKLLATALSARATLLVETGRVLEAEPLANRALELHRRLVDRHGELVDIGLLLTVRIHQGRFADVLRDGPPAADQAAQLGLVEVEMSSSVNTGIACEMTGELDAARTLYDRALQTAIRVGRKGMEAQVWGNLGNVLFRQRHLDDAAEAYRRSVELFEALGDVPGEIRGLANRANVANALGDVDGAIRYGEQAVLLATGKGFGGLTALMYWNLGGFYWTKEDFGSSAAAYDHAVEGFRDVGDRAQEGASALMLAYAHVRLGSVADASYAVQVALAAFEGLGHPEEPAARELAARLQRALTPGA